MNTSASAFAYDTAGTHISARWPSDYVEIARTDDDKQERKERPPVIRPNRHERRKAKAMMRRNQPLPRETPKQ